MSAKKTDFAAAAIGFFGGALVIAAILFTISRMTAARYDNEPKTEQAP